MRVHRRRGIDAAVILLVLLCAGCATHRVTGPDLIAQCLVPVSDRGSADSVTVGLTGPVDLRHAPVATDEAERLLFRHLFEPPLRIDCRGRAVAGFADAWQQEEDGTIWRYTLRRNLRFSDGTPVSAADIATLWQDARPDIAGLRALGDTVLEATFASPADPAVGAAPALAPWKTSESGVRIGTIERTVTHESVRGRPVVTVSGGPGPVLRFVIGSRDDPRDLLDLGVDAVVTADRATLRYADSRDDLVVLPLRWSRTYALIAGRWQASVVDRREELARDVVPVDARRADGSSPWHEAACSAEDQAAPSTRVPAVRRIVYSGDDPVARALAERLVAVAPVGNVFAEATTRAELAAGTAEPAAFAYVVTLAELSTSCEALHRHGKSVLPLVDVRSSLIARRRIGPVWIGADGLPRFDGRP